MVTPAFFIERCRPALELATRYARRRKAFGRPIRRFQAVSFMIAKAQVLLRELLSAANLYQRLEAAHALAPAGAWSNEADWWW